MDMKLKRILVLVIAAFALAACGSSVKDSVSKSLEPRVAFDSLITYMEVNGDFINSSNVPAMINAPDLYNKLDSNILVIDMRSEAEFAAAHIPNSVNVPFGQVLNYFEEKINPSCFQTIAIVCNAGQTASYTTSILRFLGYNNVYALKWGFSSWHKPTAEGRWLARKGSKYSQVIEQDANIKGLASDFPGIDTNEKFGYAILRERAQQLFAQGFGAVTLTADTLFEVPQNFYIINYWPEKLYNIGHIPGAIQYQPKKSLKRTEQLNTLPLNKPVVIYCFTGQHSAFVTAYLRLLGYDARTLVYGANSFMHSVMVDKNIGNAFSEKYIYSLPVVSGGVQPKDLDKVETAAAPRGGC